MTCQLFKNMPSGHIKVRKGSGHVFNMATPCHTTESVDLEINLFSEDGDQEQDKNVYKS